MTRIFARTDAELFRGLGYCHGSDRGLQIILLKTLVQGRLCELIQDNDELFELDRFCRRMDFGRDAAEEVRALPANSRALLDAYVKGVNQALAKRLPWELRYFGLHSATYTAVDVVCLFRLVAVVNLAQSQGEMARLLVELVQGGVSSGHLKELFPSGLGQLDIELLKEVRLGDAQLPTALRWGNLVPGALVWGSAPARPLRPTRCFSNGIVPGWGSS